MLNLPYSAEVFASLLGRYNMAIWPLPAVGVALALVALALTLRPVRENGRIISAGLAVTWAWVGVGFHVERATAIDFAAPLYGALFLVQALLLAWSGVVRGALGIRFQPDLSGWTALGLGAIAVAGYPLLALWAGDAWPGLPLAGTAPDPTVLLTLALLSMAPRPSVHLLAVPVAWCAIAGMTGWMLDTPYRLLLPAAAILSLGLAIRARRH